MKINRFKRKTVSLSNGIRRVGKNWFLSKVNSLGPPSNKISVFRPVVSFFRTIISSLKPRVITLGFRLARKN